MDRPFLAVLHVLDACFTLDLAASCRQPTRQHRFHCPQSVPTSVLHFEVIGSKDDFTDP